jgi:pimeloyl-ACP methyl ester carboxylesterase
MNILNSYLKFMSRLLGRTPSPLGIFRTLEGQKLFQSVYESTLQLWSEPYEEVFIPSRFGKTHVIVSGNPQAKPLVLLHGVLASATMWFPQINAFSQDYRLFAIDVLGDINLSVPMYLPKNKMETAEWLGTVFDGLGIGQASIAGISLGGFLALNFALHSPYRVSRMGVLDPAASLASYSPSFMLRTIPNMFSILFSKHPMDIIAKWATADGQTTEETTTLFRQMDCAIKHGRMSLRTLPSVFEDWELRQIETPVLLLMGSKTVMYNSKLAARRAQQVIKHVKVEFIPNAGHLLTLERPEIVNEKILTFLQNGV